MERTFMPLVGTVLAAKAARQKYTWEMVLDSAIIAGIAGASVAFGDGGLQVKPIIIAFTLAFLSNVALERGLKRG